MDIGEPVRRHDIETVPAPEEAPIQEPSPEREPVPA